MVCWVHDIDNWKLVEGWDTYVIRLAGSFLEYEADFPTGFVAFDTYKSLLADAEGKVSGPANVIAGFGAGATESVLAVTPFESIKTQL